MSTIITRNSANSGSVPSSLVQGELAINVTDNRLFFGSGSGNTVKEFGVTASYALNALSASYAVSASYEINYETSSSYADFAVSASNSLTASYVNPLRQTVQITGSLDLTGSLNQLGDYNHTGSVYHSGSKFLTGIFSQTGSMTITGSTTQIGNNTLLGNTTLSGSIIISGSTTVPTTPTIKIYGDMETDGVIKFMPVSKNINTSISASYIYVSGSTNDLYFSQNGSGYNNVTRLRWLEGNLYTGLLHGGLVTTQSSTVYQISSGSGVIVNLNASIGSDPFPTVQFLQWPNLSSSIAPLSQSFDQSFIAITASAGVPVITAQGTPYEDGDYNTKIPIGIVIHQNHSTINAFQTFPGVGYGWKQRSYDFIRAFGPLKISGYALSPSGSSTGSLVLSGGTSWVDGRNYTVDPNNPSYIVEATGITTSKIYRYYQSGSDWVYNTNGGAGYATIDPANYSNSGSLTPVPGTGANRQWTIQRVYYFPNSATKALYVYYGNASYASQLEAIAAIQTENFTEAPNTKANAIYAGALILRNNADFTVAASYTIQNGGLFRGSGQGGSGGGGGTTTPGGSNTQIQYNNNGAFGGVTNLTWDGTTLNATGSFSGSFTGSFSGTSSYATQALSASYASNGGVTQLLAGSNITLSPTNGLGQVTITATGGGSGVYGNTATGSYGSFYDTTTQTNPVANVNRSMSLNTTDISNGVSISGSTNPYNTYIKTTNAGVYDIQFSVQVEKTSPGGTNTTYIWLRKNGIDLAETNTAFELSQNGKGVAAWNWFVNAAANDYYQIMWSSNATDTQLTAATPAYGPTVPSVIVTANRIDQFLSNTGSFTGSFTGTLTGTASYASQALSSSYATTASYVLNAVSASYATNALSASYALTASYVALAQTASYVLNAVSSSYASTASYVQNAQTASYVLNAISSSFATLAQTSNTASYVVTAQTASYVLQAVSASYATTALSSSFASTASFVRNAQTASYVLQAVSASYATLAQTANTASYVQTAQTASYILQAVSASYAQTASYVLQAVSASFASTASYYGGSVTSASYTTTASYSNTSTSASYALSASYAPAGNPFPYNGDAQISGSLGVTGSFAVQTYDAFLSNAFVNAIQITDTNRTIYDIFGNTSIDAGGRILIDNTSNPSLGWLSRTMFDSSPAQSIDWGNRLTYDASGTATSLDWNNRVAFDATGNTSIDWSSRELGTSGGDVAVAWNYPLQAQAIDINSYTRKTLTLGSIVETFSNLPVYAAFQPDGEILKGVNFDSTVADFDLVYLNTDNKWYPVDVTTSSSSKLLGIAWGVGTGKEKVLIEGTMVVNDSALTDSPQVLGVDHGLPIYIKTGTGTYMSTTAPGTSGNYVRVLGHAYYQGVADANYWIMKFRPANDWYVI